MRYKYFSFVVFFYRIYYIRHLKLRFVTFRSPQRRPTAPCPARQALTMTLSGGRCVPLWAAEAGSPSGATRRAPASVARTWRPLSAAWALDQTSTPVPKVHRPRRRHPHSWHLATGYGTLVEGEVTHTFAPRLSDTRCQGDRGFSRLQEEDTEPKLTYKGILNTVTDIDSDTNYQNCRTLQEVGKIYIF